MHYYDHRDKEKVQKEEFEETSKSNTRKPLQLEEKMASSKAWAKVVDEMIAKEDEKYKLQWQSLQAYQKEKEALKVQASLKVSDPKDAAEKEADDVAKTVAEGKSVEPETLQAKSESGVEVDAKTSSEIKSEQGKGRPLARRVRDFFGRVFRRDFSEVKLHDDAKSQELAETINARAFTVGKDVFLGKGEKESDKELMAHELTHVVQQEKASEVLQRSGRDEIKSPISEDALKWMKDHLTGVPKGYWYFKDPQDPTFKPKNFDYAKQRRDGTWTNIPRQLHCYQAVYCTYTNVFKLWNKIPTNRNSGVKWFSQGGKVKTSVGTYKKSLSTNIWAGKKGDILFMGTDKNMHGHAVLVEKLVKVNNKELKIHTYGAYAIDSQGNDTGKIGPEVMIFKRDTDGVWRNKSHGTDNYPFNGYGKLKLVKKRR